MLVTLAYAQNAAPQSAPPPGAGLMNFVPLIVIMLVFYFFIIKPQQKKAKGHQAMLSSLKKGDQIVTSGGLYGTIVGFRGNALEVKIAENVKVLVARSAVTGKVTLGQEEPQTTEVATK